MGHEDASWVREWRRAGVGWGMLPAPEPSASACTWSPVGLQGPLQGTGAVYLPKGLHLFVHSWCASIPELLLMPQVCQSFPAVAKHAWGYCSSAMGYWLWSL